MAGSFQTHTTFNRYAADPTSRDYKLLAGLFLMSGESPQEVLSHGEEWVSPVARIEFMTIVESCPTMCSAFHAACSAAFAEQRPIHLDWKSDKTVWRPDQGAQNLDERASVEVDDTAEKVRIKIRTPIPAMRAMAAYAK